MRISDWSSDVCSSDLLGKADCIAQFDRAEGAYEKMGGAGVIDIAQQRSIAARTENEHRHDHRHHRSEQCAGTHKAEFGRPPRVDRPDERRVGNECVITCRARGSTTRYTKKTQ